MNIFSESNVMFFAVAPETVKIRLEPEELKPDTEATLICDSSSSNPPAQLSWWREGIPISGTYIIRVVLLFFLFLNFFVERCLSWIVGSETCNSRY